MMSQHKPSHLPHVEWEGLQEPYAITSVDETPAAPGAERIEMWRDEAYKMRGKLTGMGHEAFDARPDIRIGDFMTGETLTGWTEVVTDASLRDDGTLDVVKRRWVYELPDCDILNPFIHWAKGEPETFACDLSPHGVRRVASPAVKPARLTDWYLNGPDSDGIYPGVIRRELAEEYRRTVFGPDVTYPAMPLRHKEDAGYASVEYDGGRFLICEVPRGCGPSWSRNIGIEFRREWGEIPDDGCREAIGEIVAFAMGRRLMHVGFTAFDEVGWPTDEVSYNPWGDNAASVCKIPDRAPIKYGREAPHDRLETVLAELVPAYLAKRNELGLKDVLWLYWLSREATLGIDLLVASAGLDRLTNRWPWSAGSKKRGVFLEAKEFKRITRGEFKAIAAKLEGVEGKEHIMRALNAAYEIRGVRAKRDVFFAELGLPVGPVEEQALKARNPVAHGYGTSRSSGADIERMIHDSDAYLTLLERVLLKLLGYNGSYVDRSAPGFPETPLDQPMAGWP